LLGVERGSELGWAVNSEGPNAVQRYESARQG
jgi:hypothetical protein